MPFIHRKLTVFFTSSQLNFVSIRVRNISERHSGRKLTSSFESAARSHDLADRTITVFSVFQLKTKRGDAATYPGGLTFLGPVQRNQIVGARRISEDEPITRPKLYFHSKHPLVKLQRALNVANHKVKVG